jgi:hypothetical protein
VSAADDPRGTSGIPVWVFDNPAAPFDVQEFLDTRAVSDNAAPIYLAGLSLIDGELGDAHARAIAKEIGRLADIDQLVAGTIPPNQIDQVLKAAAPALQQIDAAQRKPGCVFETTFSADTNLSHVQAARTVARLSLLQIATARTNHSFALASDAIRRSLRMSRDVQPRGFAVCQLVSIAIDSLIMTAIERLTITDAELTVEQCDELLALLMEHEQRRLDQYRECLHTEYLAGCCTIADLKSGRLKFSEIIEMLSGKADDNAPATEPTFDFSVEIATCHRIFKMALDESHVPYAQWKKGSTLRDEMKRLKAEVNAVGAANQPRGADLPRLVFVLIPSIDPIREAVTRNYTSLSGVQSLVALKRYELVHRALPATLEEAFAETERKQVPADFYSSQPMRYTLLEGKPLVYSVGQDLNDDGGRLDWKYGVQPGDYLFPIIKIE